MRQKSIKNLNQFPDPTIRDSKLSTLICIFDILIIYLLIQYELTIFPVINELFSINQNWLPQILDLLDTVGSLFTIVFWCSRPTSKMEWSVALSWIILLFLVSLKVDIQHSEPQITQHIILGTFAIPCIIGLFLRIFGLLATTESFFYENRLKWLVISMCLFIIPVYPALILSELIHVKTFDVYALHFDVLLTPTLIPNLRNLINNIPGAPTLLYLAYGLTPIGLLATAILQLNRRPSHVASALLVWVVASSLAMLAYNFFPITGPRYVFENINHAFLHSSSYPLNISTPQYGARNGMPSMHFGWMLAATILWWQSGSSRYSCFLMLIETVLVILATLYFGEHYIIDLIVAVPFILSIIALCTTTVSIHFAPRIYTISAGFLVWSIWVLLLRTQLEFFMANPWTARCLVILTFLITCWQTILLSKFKLFKNQKNISEKIN